MGPKKSPKHGPTLKQRQAITGPSRAHGCEAPDGVGAPLRLVLKVVQPAVGGEKSRRQRCLVEQWHSPRQHLLKVVQPAVSRGVQRQRPRVGGLARTADLHAPLQFNALSPNLLERGKAKHMPTSL